jgi:AcrR family transcriptional regulator
VFPPPAATAEPAAVEVPAGGDSGGRRRLIEAAVRLGARARGITGLGVRELGREAGLNPNTFYRHFESLDDLGLAIVQDFATPLLRSLRAARRQAADGGLAGPARALAAAARSVHHFFDYVEGNQDVFLVAVRELHGASAVLRRRLAEILAEFANQMADDVRELELVPELGGAAHQALVRELCEVIIQQLFVWSLDYVEERAERRMLRERAINLIHIVFMGAATVASG